MIGLIAITTLALMSPNHTWEEIVQPKFQDATFTVKVVKGSQAELRKINSDFGTSYRFSYMKAKLKEPFMLRLESRAEETDVLYVMNGPRKLYRIPKIHIGSTENVANAPGKRQTVMDFGVLTPSLFDTLFSAKFDRVDRETGDLVYDLTYQHPRYDDTSRHRVWIDPDKKFIAKRVWFAQDGHEQATFIYDLPRQVNGVWWPTRLTVKNVEGKVAGVTQYTELAINTGLPDSLFKF